MDTNSKPVPTRVDALRSRCQLGRTHGRCIGPSRPASEHRHDVQYSNRTRHDHRTLLHSSVTRDLRKQEPVGLRAHRIIASISRSLHLHLHSGILSGPNAFLQLMCAWTQDFHHARTRILRSWTRLLSPCLDYLHRLRSICLFPRAPMVHPPPRIPPRRHGRSFCRGTGNKDLVRYCLWHCERRRFVRTLEGGRSPFEYGLILSHQSTLAVGIPLHDYIAWLNICILALLHSCLSSTKAYRLLITRAAKIEPYATLVFAGASAYAWQQLQSAGAWADDDAFLLVSVCGMQFLCAVAGLACFCLVFCSE